MDIVIGRNISAHKANSRPFIKPVKKVLVVINLLFDGNSTKSNHGYNLQYCHSLFPATQEALSRKVAQC